MGINQANQVLPVPSGSLQIPAVETFNSTFTDPGTPPIYFSLVLPTYNERKNVKSIVEQVTQLLDGSIPGNYELIVVDDDSPDRTWEVAMSLTPEYPQLRVMRREEERG
ncbi:MAG: glycosyltransferase, partial [Microcoleus sp. C1-bin4]|nr:glycosyltransferase [Microcoleus sp. C1-bin4]